MRVIDALLPCGRGQRIGIFGGSGVGKTTLLGSMARYSEADVNVIALIGERNREVRAFIDETLGPEGLAKSVVIAATSDRPAPVRVRATFLAAAVAEAFRDQGKDVLLIMDSVTRSRWRNEKSDWLPENPRAPRAIRLRSFRCSQECSSGPEIPGRLDYGFLHGLGRRGRHERSVADAARAVLDGHIVLSRELRRQTIIPPATLWKA